MTWHSAEEKSQGDGRLARRASIACGSSRWWWWVRKMVGSVGPSKLDLPTDHYYSTMQAWQVQTAFAALRATRRTLVYRLVALPIHPLVSSSLGSWRAVVVPHPASIRCCCDKLMSFSSSCSSVIRQSFHLIAAWSLPSALHHLSTHADSNYCSLLYFLSVQD